MRADAANKTTHKLLNDGWVFLDNKYEYLIRGALYMVRSELDREYWNTNQKEMVSPFDNTGASDFITDYLTIRSYNWNGNELPNFDTERIKVFWYKHSNRGVEAMIRPEDLPNLADVLADTVNSSIVSINEFFAKKKGELSDD